MNASPSRSRNVQMLKVGFQLSVGWGYGGPGYGGLGTAPTDRSGRDPTILIGKDPDRPSADAHALTSLPAHGRGRRCLLELAHVLLHLQAREPFHITRQIGLCLHAAGSLDG
jgi:hypothetical protein